MRNNSTKRGFTLIEVLVVIGIIAILAAIVVIAINPARQFAQANDSQRWSNVNAILNAVHQYAVYNRGALPPSFLANSSGDGTLDPICISGAGCTGANEIDLSLDLVPTYIVSMPADPSNAAASTTGYTIATTTGNRIIISAIGELTSPIEVTR